MNPAILRVLISRAKTRSDLAHARYAATLRAAEQARTHLAMLRQYRQEYDDRARCRAGDSRDPSAENNQTAFLVRLQHAVQTQVRDLAIREKAVAVAADEVALCRKKQRSLETLEQRRLEREQRAQMRLDQKDTDEFAQRTHQRTGEGGQQQRIVNAGRES